MFSIRNVEKFLKDHQAELVFQDREIRERTKEVFCGHVVAFDTAAREIFQDRDLASQFLAEVRRDPKHDILLTEDQCTEQERARGQRRA